MVFTKNQDLSDMVEGDDRDFNLTFTNADTGSAIDITGWTIKVRVKENVYETESLISKNITSHTDAANGETSFSFTDTDTEDLEGKKYYDIKVVKDTGDKQTVLRGSITFLKGLP